MFRPIHINSSQLLCACQGTFNLWASAGENIGARDVSPPPPNETGPVCI